MEAWKSIQGYEDFYEVSSFGRVRNKKTGRILRPCHANKSGYSQVTLSVKNVSNTQLIHRLVAKAFVKNPHGYNVVNHIDENKINNNADNLEWCTTQYNSTYGKGALNRNTKVNQYTHDGIFMKQWDSIKDAAQFYGIKYQGISRCCRGLRKHCYGYGWKYAGKERKWRRTAS